MIVTFIVPSMKFPVGGAKTIFELANGLARLGHQVHLVHFRMPYNYIESPDEIGWFAFEPGIVHHITTFDDDFSDLPEADITMPHEAVIIETLAVLRGTPGAPYPARAGLGANLVQGYGVMGDRLERPLFAAPCPKVCVGSWLIDVGRGLGVPEEQLVHIPNGIDHDLFEVVTPIEDRPMQVAMLFHNHPFKRTGLGIEALTEVKRRVPELTVRLFGASEPPTGLPDWMTATQLPDPATLVEEIYNGSRVMLCPSITEGFGYTSVEAMASGCALVTAANGGTDDYAVHDRNALVCAPNDGAALADAVEALLVDDARRIRIARRGQQDSLRFDWATSAGLLEALLERYLADPDHFTREIA